MAQLLVRVDDDLAREIRKVVREKYGGRKGALSLVVEEALSQALSPSTAEISTATLLELIDYVARASKGGQPKSEILANVFVMLDQDFEQSIVRGIDDMKKGKVHVSPKGKNPVAFLMELVSSREKNGK